MAHSAETTVTVEGAAVPPSGVLITPALAFATRPLPRPPYLAGRDVPSGQGLQPV